MMDNSGKFKNTIFVNGTAATSSGALTVLMQFLDGITKYDKENIYYIFSTAPEVQRHECENIKIFSNIYRHKWIGRILWDNFGIEKWAKDHGIKPDLIVSLQNTGVRLGRKVKQIIYYHQSLPMYDYKWSLLKREERKLWLYKNIYPWFVKKYFFRDDLLVVQCDWMKEASEKVLDISSDKIRVIPMTVQIPDRETSAEPPNKSGRFNIIYPATNFIFKNHQVIYQALALIHQKRRDVFDHLKFYITLDKENVPFDQREMLKANIEFLENLKYEELLGVYGSMDLMVFPSYLETVGLPLLEAAYFGMPVITSDLPYAREALRGYQGAFFVKYDDPDTWAGTIISAYENRKKYDRLLSDQRDTWEDMFLLIKQQLVK